MVFDMMMLACYVICMLFMMDYDDVSLLSDLLCLTDDVFEYLLLFVSIMSIQYLNGCDYSRMQTKKHCFTTLRECSYLLHTTKWTRARSFASWTSLSHYSRKSYSLQVLVTDKIVARISLSLVQNTSDGLIKVPVTNIFCEGKKYSDIRL